MWYCAADIGVTLNLTNIHTQLSNIPDSFKCMKAATTCGGNQRHIYLSKEGMMFILSKSRSIHCVEIATQLGMNVLEYVPSCDERENLLKLTKAFMGETMHAQFVVLKYRLDLYFPKYKLAIEFYEKYHSGQVIHDLHRQEVVCKELGCTFLIFFKNDCIFDVINRIHRHIVQYVQVGSS